jgi:CheY-like chemotaxis protein
MSELPQENGALPAPMSARSRCRCRGAAQRLLLVEDDDVTRELVAQSLRDAGYDVEEASDGREGLAAIVRESPSLIITDCTMPHMSGPELLECLALDSRFRSIPAIVISALRPLSLPSSARAFLSKPFRMKGLLTAVRDCLAADDPKDG